MPPRDWQGVVQSERFSDVMRLVHLAARADAVRIEDIRQRLLEHRRAAYEDELSIQAARVGCPGRVGALSNGAILSTLNAQCEADAASIANTYNYHLAHEIIRVREDAPRANRHVYASRVAAWEAGYWDWKQADVDQWTDGTARAMAQQDFYTFNGGFGTATLEPRTAVCPVCQGWIERGEVPLRVAMSEPPPYHIGCPHVWNTNPDKVAREDCPLLWVGS